MIIIFKILIYAIFNHKLIKFSLLSKQFHKFCLSLIIIPTDLHLNILLILLMCKWFDNTSLLNKFRIYIKIGRQAWSFYTSWLYLYTRHLFRQFQITYCRWNRFHIFYFYFICYFLAFFVLCVVLASLLLGEFMISQGW